MGRRPIKNPSCAQYCRRLSAPLSVPPARLNHSRGGSRQNRFERHSGVPDIDPAEHYLKIHGLVTRALKFSVSDLLRYPMTSRFYFLECSGNGFLNLMEEPLDMSCGALNGLVSCSEWTGVKLSVLLDEVGIDPSSSWLIAEALPQPAWCGASRWKKPWTMC